MNASTLLADLRSRGIQLTLQGEDIAYRAPKGALTPSLVESVKARKQALVDELRAELGDADSGLDQLTNTLELGDASDDAIVHPYGRFVEPIKARLLARIGLAKNYVRGEGCYLWDECDNKYVDCIAQYGGLPFGYNPDRIWEALQRVQQKKLPNVATNSMLDSAGALAERLLELCPDEMQHVTFCNSGAEATEVAIKLCRAAKQRPGILSTRSGFHGLTTGSLSVTGSPGFQTGFFVRGEHFHHVPYGDVAALDQILRNRADHFAAFMVEPIQGEAGIVVPPEGYLAEAKLICQRHDVLFVADEVQTGLGRTGSLLGCDADQVLPDVITFAKALGGGLMPIGAVVYQPHAYSTRFGLRHSSTFAGNALACQAGLAALDWIEAQDQKLVRDVAEHGAYLNRNLRELQVRYSQFVSDVRGRGYMQAIEFDFSSLSDREGLLPILAEQDLILHLMVSYLLHVHHVRVAPAFMGRSVIRIEPPLIAGASEIGQLITGLDDCLRVVESGNAAALVAAMVETDKSQRQRINTQNVRPVEKAESSRDVAQANVVGDFGFLVHLSSIQDLVQFDSSLGAFSEEQLFELKRALSRSAEPAVVGTTLFPSVMGRAARGHFILVPHTPEELLAMPAEQSVAEIGQAAAVAGNLGVALIGLGGFTSILTHGGLALDANRLPPLTSGNAFTTATVLTAIRQACVAKSIELDGSTIAVVGAAGQIGRALTLILAERAGKIILCGRDGTTERTRRGLRNVSADLVEHLNHVVDHGGPVFERVQSLANSHADASPAELVDALITAGPLVLAQDIQEIAQAEIVVIASSAVEAFIQSEHLGPGAIVCDASRPANVSSQVIEQRDDIKWIEGGLVRIPGLENMGIFAGPHADRAYACAAESALWTLEPSLGKPSAVRYLDVAEIRGLEQAGRKHGFEIVI